MFEELEKLNRRNFLAAAATASCALCSLARGADDDDDDDDDGDPPAALPPGPIDAGALSDYEKDGPYDSLAKTRHIVLTRKDGKLYALTAVCTHKKFLVKVRDGQFFCPKHSSRFTVDGVPAPKPNGKMGAAKKPLTHYSISLDEKNHVIVDTSKPIDAAKAEESGGFVKAG